LVASPAAAQPYDFQEVDAVVERFLQLSLASGVGLIITTPQQTVYQQVYGTAEPNEHATLYSASKMPSTTAILTLVSEGRLGLDDRVGNYLDNWPADKAAITIRQCLSCTAGFHLLTPPQGGRTLEEHVAQLARQPLLFPPGQVFSYSGAGFEVAGRVAEVVSGQSWSEFFDERISAPLQLRTFSYGSPQGLSPAVTGTCDLEDYAAILRLHLNNGRAPSQTVLSKVICLEMRMNQIADRRMFVRLYPFGFQYGLSWWISEPLPPAAPFVFSDQGASGATPWIDTRNHYGAFLYLKGFAPNYVEAARLWRDVAAAIEPQFQNLAEESPELQLPVEYPEARSAASPSRTVRP
jgi:CubicO group peptidase (beta-lactamase class C family)